MKRIIITLFILFVAAHYFDQLVAQNKDEKINTERSRSEKEKKLVIKIDKEENGKITKIDTTIILKEGEDPDKILEQYGVKNDKGMKHVQGYKINIEDGDTSNYNKQEKMVWVTVDDGKEDGKHQSHSKKVIIITEDGEEDVMHMLDENVMIMKKPQGNAVFHVKEFTGKPGEDSMAWEQRIDIDEKDMSRGHRKVYRYKTETGDNGKNVVILTDDIQGPPMAPMFMGMNDNSDSTIIIVKSYKDGKEITDTKRVIRNEKKVKMVMIKVTDTEKTDLTALKLKENYKKLDVKDFSINMIDSKIKINFEIATKANTSIKLIDKSGKNLQVEDLKQFQGKHSTEYDAIKGEFYIQINQESKYFVRKVMLDFD